MIIIKNVVNGPPEVAIPAHLNFGKHMLDRLKAGGTNIAQVCADTGKTATYHDILQKSVNFAVCLRKLGIKKGDVVCLSSENRFEFSSAALGISYTGATLSTLNVLYTEDELNHILNIVQPKVIICSEFSISNIAELCFPSVKHIIQFGDEAMLESVLLYKNLTHENENVAHFLVEDVDGSQDTLGIMCSSGTTGLPKGVELTHVNFLVEIFHFHYYCSWGVGALIDRLDTALSIAPWFHPLGLIVHFVMLSLNVKSVFMVRFQGDMFLKTLEMYKVNLAVVVPPVALFLAKHPDVDKYDFSNLKAVLCGAAPLDKELQAAVAKRLKIDIVAQGYGNTEMTMANMVDVSRGKKNGSCGTPSPGVSAKIIDIATGKTLGPNQTGELCLKGALRMKGYRGNRAASDELLLEDGFIRSGDVGYYDEDGYFYIVDRIKELIKYKGFQVAPAEVEACLLQHKSVLDCGVVGKPDQEAGELPLAFVVKKPDAQVTEKELIEFVAKKMSPIKQLRGGVIFIDEIPKNLSGKILRRELRKMIPSKSKV